MGRYAGPSCRLCRREGVKLFLKGLKCYTVKCPVEKRPFPPGQHGQSRIKLSDYGIQLREKQKARRIYGVYERQFKGYYQNAQKSKGNTGSMLLQQLERRLDNVMFRMGFAQSRSQGRHLVQHGGVKVNGRGINIPAFQVKVGDVVQIMPTTKDGKGWAVQVKAILETTKDRPVPPWLQVDQKELKGTIARMPERDDVGLPLQEQLIVELYSK